MKALSNLMIPQLVLYKKGILDKKDRHVNMLQKVYNEQGQHALER
jgi:hypothetical protein